MFLTKRTYMIKEEDRQFLDYVPPFSILVSGITFLVGTTLSILVYKTVKGGYDFFNQFFSELGLRKDYLYSPSNGAPYMRYAPENPEIFNFTVVVTGLLMIPFFIFSYRQMRNCNRFSTFVLFISIVSGVLTGPFLMGVGIFDLSYDVYSGNPLWKTHRFWVAGLYIMLLVVAVTWFIMLVTAKDLPYTTTKWIWQDYILLSILIFLQVVNILDGLNVIYVGDVPVLNAFPIETYQKLIPYIFFTYFGLIVGTRLTKTKYDNTPVIHEGDVGHTHKVGSDSWFCTNCGAENPEDALVCSTCSQKLS